MHIPACTTDALNILSFEDAYRAALLPNDAYDVNRWLYVPNVYTEYRYILGTRGAHPMICIGINPSTAAPDALDNTLKSVERISLYNGYDSFLMFNVYAERATNPDDMEKNFNAHLHEQNLTAFDFALSLSETPYVWAAWGTIVEKRSFLVRCMEDFVAVGRRHGAHWVTAGRRSAKFGHPHHPLYLPKTSVFEAFDIDAYLTGLKQ